MTTGAAYDAIIIGAGPNGLAAAITLARAGRSVIVFEAGETVGGGCRSQALTLPGFVHDVCSAVHPLAAASPFFRSLALERFGLQWIHPQVPLAHPLEDGTAVVIARSIAATAAQLGADGRAYHDLIAPLSARWEQLCDGILGPLRPLHLAAHPAAALALAHFGLDAVQPVQALAQRRFRGERARALFAGLGAHSMLPLDQSPTAGFALVLAIAAHAVGWPIPRGGAQQISDALASYLRSLGGEIVTSTEITALRVLPPARAVLCDITPLQLLRLAGDVLAPGYRRALERFRYGPGVFKLDLALDGPIPWTAEACARAGTVHIGGSLADIAAAEQQVAQGTPPERPFVLLAQPSLFDATRAPAGKQVVWAYCHVPNGSSADMSERIEAQIERFAPGFRARILARHTFTATQMEHYNANYIGGDINGGVQDMRQLFTRPALALRISNPYATSARGLWLCSSSTPPGGGVHGMCGYYAAQAALRDGLRPRRIGS